jgi:hypothetical protein
MRRGGNEGCFYPKNTPRKFFSHFFSLSAIIFDVFLTLNLYFGERGYIKIGNSMPEQYISFLLRLWWSGSQEKPTWRVMLENPHTQEIHGFENLDAFFSYLQNMVADEAEDLADQD